MEQTSYVPEKCKEKSAKNKEIRRQQQQRKKAITTTTAMGKEKEVNMHKTKEK